MSRAMRGGARAGATAAAAAAVTAVRVVLTAAAAAAVTAVMAVVKAATAAALMAVMVVVMAVATARADGPGRAADPMQGGAWLHYELAGLVVVDEGRGRRPGEPAPEPAARELVLAGVRLHGFLSANASVASHIGMDLAAGGTIDGGGFAYDVALFPVGVVVRAGQTSLVGVGAGVGAIGATGTIDDAVTLPVEAIAEIGGGRVRLLARARAAYVAGAAGRQQGAPSLPFADELDAMVGLRIGRAYHDHGFPTANGYFAGVAYRELAGARFLGLAIGYSIDMATPRRWVDPPGGGGEAGGGAAAGGQRARRSLGGVVQSAP